MANRPFTIRFHYFDGRAPYKYALEPCKTHEAIKGFDKIRKRLDKDNENGVAKIELKLGNRILDKWEVKAYPSRWYVVKEKSGSYFDKEGRPWGVCVPNSPRRKGNYTSQEEARRIAAERNEESIVRVDD